MRQHGGALMNQLEASFRLADGLNWKSPKAAGFRERQRDVQSEPFIHEADTVGPGQVLQSLKLTRPRLAIVVEIAVVRARRHAGKVEFDGEMQRAILGQIL